jgi:hypothetical protein
MGHTTHAKRPVMKAMGSNSAIPVRWARPVIRLELNICTMQARYCSFFLLPIWQMYTNSLYTITKPYAMLLIAQCGRGPNTSVVQATGYVVQATGSTPAICIGLDNTMNNLF